MHDSLRGKNRRSEAKFGSDNFHFGHMVASSAQGSFVAPALLYGGEGKTEIERKRRYYQVTIYLYP